jgi:putative ABC transport system substrate-binding protein
MWPVGARTQQTERVRRIGVLMPFAVASAQYQARIATFLHGLRELGWIDGRNIQIEYREHR